MAKERDISFNDLFKGISAEELKIDNPIKVPDNLYKELLDCSMERSYLDYISQRKKFPEVEAESAKITWLQMTRLPVHPEKSHYSSKATPYLQLHSQ